MELRVLEYFLMAAREENITKAARQLHVTQPTLSRQLSQLERELGVKLFQRGSHSIVLTDEGMLLRRRAQELLALADKAKREVSHEEDALAGEVAIGCGELLSMEELAEIMVAFRKRNPLVRFNVHSGNTEGVKRRIERGELDLGLLIEPVDVRTYEFVRMERREEWGALVREDSELAAKEAVRPEDLVGYPLLMTRTEQVRSEVSRWLGDRAADMDVVSTYNLLYNSAIMVRAGMGVALGLRLSGRYDGLRMVPLEPRLELGSVLAWKERQTFSTTTAAFIRFAKKYKSGISSDGI